jgi:dihydroxyacetone kinase-like protein
MATFKDADGKAVLLKIVKAVQDAKDYLGEVDGLIGDGDHGMNMNKGFTLFEKEIAAKPIGFCEGLDELGNVLFSQIGGSMGPIYGTIFMDMAETGKGKADLDVAALAAMLRAALDGLEGIVEAKVGDKTLVDTLDPAVQSLEADAAAGKDFAAALDAMKGAAEKGRDSTKNLVAKFGRSARLGERSRGVLDAGATSCCLILCAMADGIKEALK